MAGLVAAWLRGADVDQFEFESGKLRIGFCFEAKCGVDLRALVEAHFGASGWPLGGTAPTERAEAKRFSGFFELEADVSLFDVADWGGEREAASDKDGFAVADAEGLAAGEPVEEVLREIGKENFGGAV